MKNITYESSVSIATFDKEPSKKELEALKELTKVAYQLPVDSKIDFIPKT